MPRYSFRFPQPNGDCPCSCSVEAENVREAVREAVCRLDSLSVVVGATVVSDMVELGVVEMRWPGPTLWFHEASGKSLLWTLSIDHRGARRAFQSA